MVRTTAMLLLAGAMLAPTTFATFSGSAASTAAEGTPITDAATAEVSFPGAAGSATLPYWPRSVAPGRRLQDDVPVPTAVPLPAPTAEFCGLGNPKGNVCCGGYEECHGSCGGAGCDLWDGGAALCCARTIRKAGVECEDHADVGCLIPWSSQPSTSAVPLPAPTAVPVPAPSAVQLSSTSDASVWNLTLTPHDTFLHATIDCFGEEGSFVDVRWCRTDALGDVVGRRVDCHPTSTNTTLARFAAQLEHLVAAFDASGVALASWKFTAGDAGIANENAPGNLAGVYINKNEPFVVPRGDLTAEVVVVDLSIALPGRLRSAYTTNLVYGALVGIDRLGHIVWHLPPTSDMVADPDRTLTKGMGTIEQKFNSDGSTLVARQWGAGMKWGASIKWLTVNDASGAEFATMRDTEVVIDTHECIFDFTGDRVVVIGADLESSIAWNLNLTAAQANVDPAYDSTPFSLAADFNEWWSRNEDWGALSRNWDWLHLNSIRRVPASVGGLSVDYYIASLRHLSAVVAFSYNPDESSSEDIAQHLWTLSGEVDSDFQLQSDLDGVDPRFWNQHDASILDNGNLLLFDNANVITWMATGERTFDTVSFMPNTEQRTTSRAVEYQLDFTTMTATLVWEFQCDFAYSRGSARRLNNGHTVIGCAWCGDAGTIFEADEDGNEVGALVLPASINTGAADGGDDSGDGRFYRTTSWKSISGEQRIANLTPAELLGSMTASPTVAPSVSSAPTSVPTPEPISSTPPPTQTPIPVPTHTPSSIPTPVPLPAPTTVPVPAPSAVPLPVPTMVPLPAPTAEFCGLGNLKGIVCCGGYEECHGSCGGARCGSRDGGRALCCASTIRSAGVACEDPADVGCLIPVPSAVPIPVPTTAPVPAPTAVPLPAPSAVPLPVPTSVPLPAPTAVPLSAPTAEFCGLGNPKGNVCCGGYEECHGSCGGAGCGSWDGGAALCCARTIRKAGVECEDHADVGCLIPWSSQPSTSPAPTRIPDEPSARPSPAPTPRPTDGGDWSDAAWRSAGEWAGSFETGQSHVVRPVNETRCCCCSLAFYRPAESSIRPRSDDAPLWVGRWCHPPATSERCAVVGRRGRYAPRVTAERELELLFTPSAAGVSGGGGGVPSDADDVRVTAWARGARRLGTLAARPPSALRAALEQALTYDRLSPYSDAAWSATLPWDWVVENATLRVGWRRAAAADGGGGDGGLVSATLELRDLAHWSLFTVSRTKVAIFGGASDVAALDDFTFTPRQLAHDLFGAMTVAELRWVDSPLWHLPYLVVSTSAGAVRVDSEAARRAAMEAAGDDADTEPGWDVLKNQV